MNDLMVSSILNAFLGRENSDELALLIGSSLPERPPRLNFVPDEGLVSLWESTGDGAILEEIDARAHVCSLLVDGSPIVAVDRDPQNENT